MEFKYAHTNTTAKLPILKLENGNSRVSVPQKAQENGTSVTKMSVPMSLQRKPTKKKDVKARSLLLMALPNEHQLHHSGAQNLAFMTAPSTSSTNDVNTAKPAYEVSTVSSNVNLTSPQVSTASFSDNDMYAFMVENPNGSNLLQQDLEQIMNNSLEAIDMKCTSPLLRMRQKRFTQTNNIAKAKAVNTARPKAVNTVRPHLTVVNVVRVNQENAVLDLEKANDAQAKEIAGLKKREDASKHGRSFKDIDKDVKVSLVDETQGRSDDVEMFDTDNLHGDEVIVDMVVGEKQSAKVDEREVSTGVEDSVAPTIPVTTAGEGVTATKIDEITTTSAPTTAIDEITLAQTLIEIKAAKPKAITTAATTTTTTRPKARGVVVQEPSEFRTTTSSPQASQPSKTKDKGKAIMIEPEVPLKKKDQVALDEEMARNLEAQLQAELIEEERLARKKEEEANIALIESWENTQAMMEADRLLAERLQTREQEELTDEEKAKLFMEFMEKRRKHFAALRAQEKRKRPPTKTQKRNQMSIYLKHMGGYKHNQLKGRSYDEIQKLFDKEMKRVNSFVAMNSEAQEISGKKDESSSKKAEIAQDSSAKRAGDKLESDKSKKQKTDENEEVEVDNEAELKKHMVTVKDDDIAIDAIPLATKPPVIVEYKLIREGIMGHYQLIRADGSFKRYSSMIRMLQGIDREDLQTLWKLVKTKHGDTRPEDEHERVLWGDLKVMFEPDIKSDVWRNLQGYKVTVWKLFDSCGVHFVRFGNVHIFMLVEKRYPLTPITITNMLNKKLQADYWNEMCYQLLKLMVKQQKGQ
ncbi:hypothetical protein Tco_1456389 [Tanacetum coccineum]